MSYNDLSDTDEDGFDDWFELKHFGICPWA